jgi:predicted PhzF superfamily epimerase YddE/YHI9
MGIDEDYVTGSAHCVLVPFWSKILRKKRMYARQVSSRGGNLECSLKGDRIQLIGNVYIESERVKNV